MTILLTVAFVGLIVGGFLIFAISPLIFTENLLNVFHGKKKSLQKQVKHAVSPKKMKGIRKTILESKAVLEVTGKSGMFPLLGTISISLFAFGTFIALSMGNSLMIPILAVGLALLPFWYVIFTANFYKKAINAELETALSIITTSYLRNENMIFSVEENVSYLNPPVCDVFRQFLAQATLVNGNVAHALEQLKYRISSEVFHEWVDAMIACQEDKTLKTTLTPIISKLSDMRVVSAELDLLLYEPMKEFVTMALLLIGNIPLIYFLNRDWFHTLTTTIVGKGVLALSVLLLFISLAAVIRLTKPIEYKR